MQLRCIITKFPAHNVVIKIEFFEFLFVVYHINHYFIVVDVACKYAVALLKNKSSNSYRFFN